MFSLQIQPLILFLAFIIATQYIIMFNIYHLFSIDPLLIVNSLS